MRADSSAAPRASPPATISYRLPASIMLPATPDASTALPARQRLSTRHTRAVSSWHSVAQEQVSSIQNSSAPSAPRQEYSSARPEPGAAPPDDVPPLGSVSAMTRPSYVLAWSATWLGNETPPS